MRLAFSTGSRVEVWPPLPLPRSTFGRCLLLAALLHLWLVLMIGTAPGGTALPGEGVWGRLEVRLAGPPAPQPVEPAPTPPVAAPPRADVDTGPPGTAERRRYGGAVRTRPTPPAVQPGAAELGQWNATPAEQRPEPAPDIVPAPAPEAVVPTARLQTPPQTVERLRRPAPAAPRAAAAKPAPDLLKPLPEAAPVEAPPAPPEPVPVEAPPVLRELPEAAPLARPRQAAQPLAVPRIQQPSAPETLAVPKALPEIAPATTTPAPTPNASSTAPAATAAPTTTNTPAAPSLVPIAPPVGAPDAGARVGRDLATPPSAPSTRQPLDLRMPVNGPVRRQTGSNSMLDLMPHPPDAQSKLSEDMKKSGRGDCRNEHAGAGLLAAIPLAIDAARDKGCKW